MTSMDPRTATSLSPSAAKKCTSKGEPYLLRFALPNFYFHATTAYGLMRACGVTIGNRDFIGAI